MNAEEWNEFKIKSRLKALTCRLIGMKMDTGIRIQFGSHTIYLPGSYTVDANYKISYTGYEL